VNKINLETDSTKKIQHLLYEFNYCLNNNQATLDDLFNKRSVLVESNKKVVKTIAELESDIGMGIEYTKDALENIELLGNELERRGKA